MRDLIPFLTMFTKRRIGASFGIAAFAASTLGICLVLGPAAASAQTVEEGFSAAKGGKKHKKRRKRPIELGVSGGNGRDVMPADEPGFVVCSSGTLGGLLEKKGEIYIVSNNHVLAQLNEAKKGDPINQPGLIDNECADEDGDHVAELTGYRKIRFNGKKNKADVAIALAMPGMVDPQGKILQIGIPGDTAIDPEVGMKVQKSGRTSGLTKGTIEAIDVTALVSFSDDEAQARFTGQFIVSPKKSIFIDSGDSGSIIYVDEGDCPSAVGLAFAGNDDGWGAASPMKKVLKEAKKIKPKGTARLVGCSSEAAFRAKALAASAMPLEAKRARREIRRARRVKRAAVEGLLSVNGVFAVGVGWSAERRAAEIHVMVEEGAMAAKASASIPREIDGVATKVIATSRFRAF